jgi:hypothetical protein
MYLVIHPPIILENLLPVKATFELVHANKKTILWSSVIGPGKMKSVHTVTLDEPILLSINLDFCRSSEGVLIHKPSPVDSSDSNRLTAAIKNLAESILDDSAVTPQDTFVTLTDSVGQRLCLQIENKLGNGKQRNVVVYCPYWIVNTSQYTIRLKEDGGQYLPAGTVTARWYELY